LQPVQHPDKAFDHAHVSPHFQEDPQTDTVGS